MKKLTAVSVFLVSGLMTGTTQETAQKIMGKNYIGIADVQNSLGVKYTPEQRKVLATIPYSEATLRETATTHILVAGYPLTFSELMFSLLQHGVRVTDYQNVTFASRKEGQIAFKLVSENRIGLKLFQELFGSWRESTGEGGVHYAPLPDSNVRVALRWYLLQKEIFFPAIPKTGDEIGDDGKKELKLFTPTPGAKYEGIPSRELLYVMTLNRIARGEELFSQTTASTSTDCRIRNYGGKQDLTFKKGELVISDTVMYYMTGFKDRPRLGRAALRKYD